MLNSIIKYFLENKLVTVLLLVALIGWGIITAPFGWKTGILPSDPVPVDAIPDIGENQQIVFTQWPGRSPQDIEDQISYPLTTYLLGIPGVKSVRSTSIFGFSSIYIIFDEGVEFYWSRSRILEKLNSLPAGLLPDEVKPSLGPDATALGQVFWYTLEGRDAEDNPTGGWDLHEIRRVQDFYVKFGLNATEGVSEVASIGGYVQEYQIDVNPDALKAYQVPLHKVMQAVQKSNRDVGAKTIEINQAEYMVRGLGYIKSLADIEEAVVSVQENVPVRIKDLAVVSLGPATRRGMLDKDGAEVVGGVVVARYGSNPLQVINNVKDKIREISPGLPKKTLADGRESQLAIVPFYDRSQLIHETLGTLEEALSLEVLITILVVLVMVLNLRASLLISSLLPVAVLMVFIAMRYFGVDANIVALSGIAIAIGTMVDLGIILSENVLKHIDEAPPGQRLIDTIYKGASEVSSAILAAVSTTIVSFIPVFTMQAAEGKLFRPLAFTKTFALLAAVVVALLILPSLAHWFFGFKIKRARVALLVNAGLIVIGLLVSILNSTIAGVVLSLFGLAWFIRKYSPYRNIVIENLNLLVAMLAVAWLLAEYWLPLGAGKSFILNLIFVFMVLGSILGAFALLEKYYKSILRFCLQHKKGFLSIPALLIILGLNIWLGFANVFGFIPAGFEWLGLNLRNTTVWSSLSHTFPGIGEEFMPSLDEGSYLLMPSSMPHSGVAYNEKAIAQMDMLLANIPEVELAVGKLGRVESALDPAPVSMFENIINYKPEYVVDENGRRMTFLVNEQGWYRIKINGNKEYRNKTGIGNREKGNKTGIDGNGENGIGDTVETRGNKIVGNKGGISGNKGNIIGINRDKVEGGIVWFDKVAGIFYGENGDTLSELDQHQLYNLVGGHTEKYLIEDEDGEYFRNWRPNIHSPDDIWNEIVKVTQIPGLTSAPKLQPIETRLIMLQTGMRAPMGVKVYGPDLKTVESFGLKLEHILKRVPSVKTEAVFADRIVGKPYLELKIDRGEIARYGLNIEDVQQTIETAIGGMKISTTVEGRERFPIRIRYPRELRDNPESIQKILLSTPSGAQIPLGQVVEIKYVQGPQAIKSEETFLVGYVLFDKRVGHAEVDVVQKADRFIKAAIDSGELTIPEGIRYKFSGSYENQIRAEKRLAIVVPLVLAIVFLILYFQFKSISTSLMVFTGIAMAFSGGFIMLWLYGQGWFGNFTFFGVNIRDLFQMHTINLSVAVWVGFIALFGIATDDGVLMGTYLDQSFARNKPNSISEIREAVIEAGQRRIKPAVMTSATTIIALLPVLTSTGRGSDIMIPMAIPAFGGMIVAAITYFIVPVLYCWREEVEMKSSNKLK